MPPVFLHDPREHLDASVVQFLPLQVEGVDAQRRPAVVVHVQGDVRIEPAELAEALSELDHHDRIVLLDELLGKVQGKGGLAAAGSGYDHPVTGVDPLLARIPDVLSQRDLVHPVMHIDALAVIPETAALEKEAQPLLKRKKGFTIAMCIEGKQLDSPQFAQIFQRAAVQGDAAVTFFIGSSYGLADSVKQAANLRLSMSAMTFPHQLARVMLLEQIYRGYQILGGSPYHK